MKLLHRIVLLILIAVSLTSLANFLLIQYLQRSMHSDSEEILAKTVVQSLRSALVQDVIDGNKLTVTNLLRSIQGHDNPIEYLYVTDTGNKVFAHSFERGFPRYLAQNLGHKSRKAGINLDQKFQTSKALIYEYSEVLIPGLDATLHIGINQTEIAERLAENAQNILIVSMLIIILAFLFAYMWGKKVTLPLAQFTQQIQLFGKGKAMSLHEVAPAVSEMQELTRVFKTAAELRQKALDELQKREQDLAITLNSIGDAVIATDAEGKITRMNPVAEQLTQWTVAEAQGLSVKQVFPIINATTGESIENPIEKVLSTGETVYLSNDTTLIAKDGTQYQISDSAAPIRNENNDIIGMVLIFNDVTEKYQLRSNINKQLDRFKQLSNLALTLTGNPQDIFNKVSEMIGKLLEVKVVCLSEIRGDELYFLSVYADGQVYSDAGHCDLSITPCSTVEEDKDIRIYQRVSELFPEASFLKDNNAFSYCGFPALDSEGNVLAVTCLLDDKPHDFTDEDQDLLRIFGQRIGLELEHIKIQDKLRKQDAQIRLTQKMDALGKLTGGLAHDYNNMLGVICGYAELLGMSLNDQPKLFKYVSEILHASERGSKLTKKLLAFSRQKSSVPNIQNLNDILLNQQHMLEKTLTVRIKLELDLARDLWPVWLDASDMEDTILNMCINSMHAIESTGQLTIQTRNQHLAESDVQSMGLNAGDYVVLSIIDTGCGMDEVTKEKMFDPFYSTKGSQGTGLGLSQVYGFVEYAKGTIKVDSEPGQGAEFKLYFPRHQQPIHDEPISQIKQVNDYKGTETILVVDDEPALRELTCEMLNQNGYTTLSAEGSRQALEILENQSINLLLTDVIMPEMDGFQLAMIVQKQYPFVKILLASGFSDDRHVNNAEYGFHENILYKPFKSEALVERVRELLDS